MDNCAKIALLNSELALTIERIPTAPFETFEERMAQALSSKNYDVVFSSLVFFNSGFYADRLLPVLMKYAQQATVIIDAYHAIGAVPLDLSAYKDRMFFVGGGYKYLGAGEGACFMSVPTGCRLRPLMTGWLADYGVLNVGMGENVGYPNDASRFAGATYDPSGWYRFNAVMDWWHELGIRPALIHSHVRELQMYFIKNCDFLTVHGFESRSDWGHFLTFPMSNAQEVVDLLRAKNVFVDARDGLLRIGFGYYQSISDVDGVINALAIFTK